jgi:hypothetical protein
LLARAGYLGWQRLHHINRCDRRNETGSEGRELMRKLLIGFALAVLIGVPVYLRLHRVNPPLEAAYVASRQLTLWSTTAQVREPVATVTFGDRLDVLGHSQDQVRLRTAAGVIGWAGEQDLLSAELWQKALDLSSRTATLPVEGHGHTGVLSNLHLDPGRDSPRIRQLRKDVPVDLFERQALEIPETARPRNGEEPAATGYPKKEDWWLVRAYLPDRTTVAGWMLGRFIALNVPEPIPDYASAAGIRIVAWFELNRVMDPSGEGKPQYLVVGIHGEEGQPCDFTLLRVYTWSIKRERYETAYVENGLCGKLPVKITKSVASAADMEFSFQDSSSGPFEERTYRMHQTIVRRLKETGAGAIASGKRR